MFDLICMVTKIYLFILHLSSRDERSMRQPGEKKTQDFRGQQQIMYFSISIFAGSMSVCTNYFFTLKITALFDIAITLYKNHGN